MGTQKCNTDPRSNYDPAPKGRVGKSFLNTAAKYLAEMCGFDNKNQVKGRTCRRTGITKMANAGVSSGEMCGAARHKSISVNTAYQARNIDTNAKRQACFHMQPLVSKKQKVTPDQDDFSEKENTPTQISTSITTENGQNTTNVFSEMGNAPPPIWPNMVSNSNGHVSAAMSILRTPSLSVRRDQNPNSGSINRTQMAVPPFPPRGYPQNHQNRVPTNFYNGYGPNFHFNGSG